jgi:hypothetical protein
VLEPAGVEHPVGLQLGEQREAPEPEGDFARRELGARVRREIRSGPGVGAVAQPFPREGCLEPSELVAARLAERGPLIRIKAPPARRSTMDS